MFVTQALKNEGYKVLGAADMQEALHVSDVIPGGDLTDLTDIVLPTGNGMNACRGPAGETSDDPILYMSGAGADAIHALQFRWGAYGGFLEKPFSPRAW